MYRRVIALLICAVVLSEATMLGGYKKKDGHENDASTQEAAKFAVAEIGKKSNKELKLERVVDAYTQVVAGLNYRLVLEVSGGGPSHLEAVVYEPLGGKPLELTSFKEVGKDEADRVLETASERQEEAVSGKSAAVSTSDPGVKKAADFAVQTLAGASNSLYPLTLTDVVGAQSRVTEKGQEYELELRMSQNTMPDKVYQVTVVQQVGNGGKFQLQCSHEKA